MANQRIFVINASAGSHLFLSYTEQETNLRAGIFIVIFGVDAVLMLAMQ